MRQKFMAWVAAEHKRTNESEGLYRISIPLIAPFWYVRLFHVGTCGMRKARSLWIQYIVKEEIDGQGSVSCIKQLEHVEIMRHDATYSPFSEVECGEADSIADSALADRLALAQGPMRDDLQPMTIDKLTWELYGDSDTLERVAATSLDGTFAPCILGPSDGSGPNLYAGSFSLN